MAGGVMSVPIEVWRKAWTNAASRDLKALSASCRSFRDICQPMLFDQLGFVGAFFGAIHDQNYKKIMQKLERNRDRLRAIAASAHIPPMVRYWTFNVVPDATILREDPQVVSSQAAPAGMDHVKAILALVRTIHAEFSANIHLYTNLSRLMLTGCSLSPAFCQALASMSRLTRMDLTGCDIICPVSSGPIALTEFTCSNEELQWADDLAARYNLVSNAKLEDLELCEPVPARAFLTAFAAAGTLPSLHSLTVRLSHDAKDVFYRFLGCCPELRFLELEAPASFADVTLPATTAPVLCTLGSRVELAGILTAGRPVHQFKFLDGGEENERADVDKEVLQQALLLMSKSSETLVDMILPCIPLDSSILRLVAELFPKIKRLEFSLQSATQGDGDWETEDGGSSEVDEEIIEDQEQESNEGGGWYNLEEGGGTLLQTLLGLSSNEMRDLVRDVQNTCEDLRDGAVDDADECRHSVHRTCVCCEEAIVDSQNDIAKDHTYEDFEPGSMAELIRALGNDAIPLPRSIQLLVVKTCGREEEPMADTDTSAIVDMLGARYPTLREVDFTSDGCPRVWKRKAGGDWKHGPAIPIQAILDKLVQASPLRATMRQVDIYMYNVLITFAARRGPGCGTVELCEVIVLGGVCQCPHMAWCASVGPKAAPGGRGLVQSRGAFWWAEPRETEQRRN
ncbi:hypothetical protein GGX14DRAFT_538621 [Mycena pura]|uniref:F-box domain-containing protein n=1 Tax=Mycena pura TaxID=153505 RepID=A0AAD6YSU5_9AGAR|nr:hypothetical protein GGX14DRAFT_538621 [Mycena pura]